MAIETRNIAKEYKDVVIDPGYTILKDMFFGDDKRHLFVLTPNKVSSLNEAGPVIF